MQKPAKKSCLRLLSMTVRILELKTFGFYSIMSDCYLHTFNTIAFVIHLKEVFLTKYKFTSENKHFIQTLEMAYTVQHSAAENRTK